MISAKEAQSNISEYEIEYDKKLTTIYIEARNFILDEIKQFMKELNKEIQLQSLQNGKNRCFKEWIRPEKKLKDIVIQLAVSII